MSEGTHPRRLDAFGGISLLFAAGKRPDRRAIRDFAEQSSRASISFDPADNPDLQVIDGKEAIDDLVRFEHQWIEFVTQGLTYDLVGLMPLEATSLPEIEYNFDFEGRPSAAALDAMRLIPGPHLAGGENTLPVLKAMFGLACELTRHFEEIQAIAWPPAKSVIGRQFFESSVRAWIEGGAFPALGLTAFRETVDGAIQSVGLEFLIGQELRLEPSLAEDRVSATRLGARLINQLVLVGRVTEGEYVISPDGSRLRVEPSDNGKFVRVGRE